MDQSYKQWVEERLKKQPVFNELNDAIKHARKRSEEGSDVCSVYKEPKERGGRYVVIDSESYEIAYREGYDRVVDYLKLKQYGYDEIEEV